MRRLLTIFTFACFFNLFVMSSLALTEDTNKLKLGVFLPLSGDNSYAGQAILEGITFANKLYPEIAGRKIEIVLRDDKSDKQEAITVAKDLVQADVEAVIGGYTSDEFLATLPIFEQGHIVAITPTGTHPDITKNRKYAFRSCFSDLYQAKVVASYMFNELGARNVAILFDIESKDSSDLAEFFATDFQKLGGKITGKVRYMGGNADFTTQINKLEAIDADIIYFPGFYNDVIRFLLQAESKGLNRKYMCSDNIDEDRLFQDLDDITEKIMHSTFAYDADMPDMNPVAKDFTQKWRKVRRNKNPDVNNIMGYTAYYILYKALEVDADTANLTASLESLQKLLTPMGVVNVGANHEIETHVGFVSYKYGKRLYLGDYLSTVD